MRRQNFISIVLITTSTCALAADYPTRREMLDPPRVVYVGIPGPRPVLLVPSPPQYVQDSRTGWAGWVVLQPSFMDRLFGERNGY
jgi:hypothetical protein